MVRSLGNVLLVIGASSEITPQIPWLLPMLCTRRKADCAQEVTTVPQELLSSVHAQIKQLGTSKDCSSRPTVHHVYQDTTALKAQSFRLTVLQGTSALGTLAGPLGSFHALEEHTTPENLQVI